MNTIAMKILIMKLNLIDKINETLMKNLEEEDKEAYDNFVLVKKEIEDTTPDIKSILKSPIELKIKLDYLNYLKYIK